MNLITKISTIAGLAAGIIYMILSLVGTYRTAPVPEPLEIAIQVIVFTIFFAPFGAAIGLGVGLLLSAFRKGARKSDG